MSEQYLQQIMQVLTEKKLSVFINKGKAHIKRTVGM